MIMNMVLLAAQSACCHYAIVTSTPGALVLAYPYMLGAVLFLSA
jgi:hypothetical protein